MREVYSKIARSPVTNQGKIKIVSTISEPPNITTADLSRVREESRQLHEAFNARTARMEILTVEDLKILVRRSKI